MHAQAPSQTSRILASLNHGVTAFCAWWIREIRSMFADWLPGFASAENALMFRISRAGIAVVAERGGDSSRFVPFGLGATTGARECADAVAEVLVQHGGTAGQVVVELSPDVYLETTFDLPAKTTEHLDDVVRFEMPRRTPFAPGSAVYHYDVIARSSERDTVTIRLRAVPSVRLDPILSVIESIAPDTVHCVLADGTPFPLQVVNGRQHDDRHRRINLVVFVTVAVLLCAAVAWPLYTRYQSLAVLESVHTQVRGEVSSMRDSFEAIETLRMQSAAFSELRDTHFLMLDLLGTISEAVPDEAYFTSLDVQGSEISVSGRARSAARLLTVLEAHPSLHGVKFTSPVNTDAENGDELFKLVMQYTGNPHAATATE